MSWFSRTPVKAAPKINIRARAYEATSTKPRVADWEQIDYGPNSALADAPIARARAQDAVRNNPWIGHALRLLVSHTVGCGIQPHSTAASEQYRAQINSLWPQWESEADADGTHHFCGLQTLIVRAAHESGECFVRLRPRRPEDNLTVPLQVQVLESAMVPVWLNAANGGNTIRQGIELTPFGKRAAYWFYPQHPGDNYLNPASLTDLIRVPAESVLHHYNPQRPGQLRGAPTAISALYRARNLDHYESAELTRKKNKARFSGAIWRDNPEDNPLTDAPANPILNQLQADLRVAETYPDDPDQVALAAELREQIIEEQQRKTFVDIEDGYMLQLAPTERVELFSGDTGNTGAVDFLRSHLRAIAAAWGVPFELMSGDYSGTNDRIMRVILNTFYRDLEIAQERLIHQVLQPVRNAWMDAAYLSGALALPGYPDSRRAWQATEWRAHAWSYVNPLQEAQTAVLRVKYGLTSRRAAVAAEGWDVEEIDRQQAEDHTREESLDLHYGDMPDNAIDPVQAEKDTADPQERPT